MSVRVPAVSQFMSLVLFTILLIGLLFFTERSQSVQLLTLFGGLAVIYIYWIREKLNTFHVATAAIFLRLIAWVAFPTLSDDIYRFIWDGSLILDGINPFLFTPTELLEGPIQAPYSKLFDKLNSANYYSVYPIVIQGISAIGALANNDIYLASLIIRFPILLAELGTIYYLPKLLNAINVEAWVFKLYALNPLVIIELCGNAHFEGVMIFFLVMSFWWISRNKLWEAGVALALAIATKLIPILFIPFLLKMLEKNDRWKLMLALVVSGLLLFAPILQPELIQHFLESINLYFQRFEFNASLYYLVRFISIEAIGYNQIAVTGPILSSIFLIVYALIFFFGSRLKWSIHQQMLIALSAYFFLATTVHPWYLTTLVFLATFRWQAYAVLWSLLAFLSYLTYSTASYQESTVALFIEYGIVFLAIVSNPWLRPKLASALQLPSQ